LGECLFGEPVLTVVERLELRRRDVGVVVGELSVEAPVVEPVGGVPIAV